MSTVRSAEQGRQQKHLVHLSGEDDSLIQLGSDLWIDLDGGMIIRQQEKFLLTARELLVLRVLIHSWQNGRQYMSARVIADRIHLSDIYNPEHSIEQTISLLRRKLGETVYQPRFLHGRRGYGYRLFSETKPDINSP